MAHTVDFERDILSRVEHPGQYLGTELNSVHKDPRAVDLRVALAFPDLYDLGLGNLGLLILYAILNDLPWCACERAYAPAPDLDALLRELGAPLFAVESKDPLHRMDLLGFTLQSELTYTNVLNMLDLGGVPLRAADRTEEHPLVCAGGPTAYNPEPMAPFMDFFVIGDGEEAVVEVAECLRALKGRSRRERLEALASIPGVYVPALYPMETLPDGRIVPVENGPRITKRVVTDLDRAPFPTCYIVPFTQQVHDRVGLDVLRGCTHGCRFCQAGMVGRPVRERTVDTVDRLMQEALDRTGYEEVSLVSLSTCDHSHAAELVQRAAERARATDASVSLPSLRLDTFAIDLADRIAGVRRSGLTFAPEAATPRLRAVINKWIPDEDFIAMSREAFRRGWTHVKAYFMIGLPTERDEDVEAIVDLCLRTLDAGKTVNRRARVHTGVSTFVPKPFTPFQWAAQIPMEETIRRQGLLREGFAPHNGIKFGRHTPESTFIEGMLSRADRRAADLIETAWRLGARMDSSDEHLNMMAWRGAIDETGYNVEEAFRARDLNERLPWDHIDVLIPKSWLRAEWQRALDMEHVADCRQAGCHGCGVSNPDRPLCERTLREAMEAARTRAEQPAPQPLPEFTEPPTAQRIRLRIARRGLVRFLSHLETVSMWIRALRRVGAPLSHSQGFHAHPKINFATAAPVGEESEADYMDILLREPLNPAALQEQLNATLPEGFRVFDAMEIPIKAPSLMSDVTGFSYIVRAPGDAAAVQARIEAVLNAEHLPMPRKAKGKAARSGAETVAVNVRPMITRLALANADPSGLEIELETQVVETRGVRPREVLALLGIDPDSARVLKAATRLASDAALPV